MSKVKYYYDSENLAYRKNKNTKKKKIGVIVLLLAAVLFGFEFYNFIEFLILKRQRSIASTRN
jgi:hypothetical protein